MNDPWYFYLIVFVIGMFFGGLLIGILIARDKSVVKLDTGMVVTSREFIEQIQQELMELRKRMMG